MSYFTITINTDHPDGYELAREAIEQASGIFNNSGYSTDLELRNEGDDVCYSLHHVAALKPERTPGYCKHGTWVGGMGIDWMCGRCEDGDD